MYGRNLYEGERESNGKYTFAAHMDGVYRYCFSNKMSTMTPKIVMFTMEILEKEAEKAAGEEGDAVDSHNKLEDMIKELGTALTCKMYKDSVRSKQASNFVHYILKKPLKKTDKERERERPNAVASPI